MHPGHMYNWECLHRTFFEEFSWEVGRFELGMSAPRLFYFESRVFLRSCPLFGVGKRQQKNPLI